MRKQGDRRLETWPCQSVCTWSATGDTVAATGGDLALFECTGCGTQWVRTQEWTPVDADGVVPPKILAERQRGAAGSPS